MQRTWGIHGNVQIYLQNKQTDVQKGTFVCIACLSILESIKYGCVRDNIK